MLSNIMNYKGNNMNIIFYKLLARNELLEQAKYIQNARDFDYALENSIRNYGYNPIEKLKELEDDLDAQLLVPEVIDLIESKTNYNDLDRLIEYLKELDYLINVRFKFYGIFITKQIYNYLSTKEINESKEN